jgi:hypothetical protein
MDDEGVEDARQQANAHNHSDSDGGLGAIRQTRGTRTAAGRKKVASTAAAAIAAGAGAIGA